MSHKLCGILYIVYYLPEYENLERKRHQNQVLRMF